MAILDEHQPPAATSLRFGDFELRLDSGELLRSGVRVSSLHYLSGRVHEL